METRRASGWQRLGPASRARHLACLGRRLDDPIQRDLARREGSRGGEEPVAGVVGDAERRIQVLRTEVAAAGAGKEAASAPAHARDAAPPSPGSEKPSALGTPRLSATELFLEENRQ